MEPASEILDEQDLEERTQKSAGAISMSSAESTNACLCCHRTFTALMTPIAGDLG